jgi:hypothetical protein
VIFFSSRAAQVKSSYFFTQAARFPRRNQYKPFFTSNYAKKGPMKIAIPATSGFRDFAF